MNAVEIEEAVSALMAAPFNRAEFPYQFLAAFDVPLACLYAELASHFGFFLPLAGISTVAEIKDNPIDIKAAGRLNKLYVELLRRTTRTGQRMPSGRRSTSSWRGSSSASSRRTPASSSAKACSRRVSGK